MSVRPRGRFWSFIAFTCLIALIPLSLFLAGLVITRARLCWLFRSQVTKQIFSDNRQKTILLTGGKMTKALQLTRFFKRAGHRVILTETSKYKASGHAFSNCVDTFELLPQTTEGYGAFKERIINLVRKHNVDEIIPVSSPTEAQWISRLMQEKDIGCTVQHHTMKTIEVLDDKYNLCVAAREAGLTAPEVYSIETRDQLKRFNFSASKKTYILKSTIYDPIERLRRPRLPFEGQEKYFNELSISPERPWVMQEFIDGSEYCTHTVAHQGKITLHCCCPSSDFQLRYKHVEHPSIFEWVDKFVSTFKITGQISFDFIVDQSGRVLPIECNPRTHSALTAFYNSDHVSTAYLPPETAENDKAQKICTPERDARETFWLYYELYLLISSRSIREIRKQFSLLFQGKEAVLDPFDVKPFLMVNHWQIPALLASAILSGKPWVRIDFNIGKLVEAGGD